MKLSALAAALALAASPALAQSARVVDGDTLKVDGVTYRLWGIDAPESGQPCADGWPAGRAATEHLRALIGERTSPANLGRSIATAALSQFAMSMAATSGPTWWPMVMPGPSSDIAATMSMRSARRRRCEPASMATPASLHGSGELSGDKCPRISNGRLAVRVDRSPGRPVDGPGHSFAASRTSEAVAGFALHH
jgi:hypothetical protein